MQYTKFGRTGLRVSRLCLGTMTFGLQCDEAQSRAILDTAADGGIDFLDTADVYPLGGGPNTVGRTEEIVGRWLKGKRHDFILATKCVGQMGPKPWDQGMSRKHILDAIDASLKRLGTDYVDLYQLHGFDPTTPIDEALEALDTVVRSGKARYVGVSNWLAYQARPRPRPQRSQEPRAHRIRPAALQSSVPQPSSAICCRSARRRAIAVIPYNPLAGGLLTGKHDRRAAARGGHALPARQCRCRAIRRATGTNASSKPSMRSAKWPERRA